MAGYSPTALANKVRNGNSVSILVGDQIVGFAQNLTVATGTGAESLYGVGSAKPQENQQLRFSINVSLDSLELTEEGMNYFGITTSWAEVIMGNKLTFHEVDYAGNTLRTVVGCVAENFTVTTPVNQPITQTTSFIGMDVLNSSGKSILSVDPGGVTTDVSSLISNIGSAV